MDHRPIPLKHGWPIALMCGVLAVIPGSAVREVDAAPGGSAYQDWIVDYGSAGQHGRHFGQAAALPRFVITAVTGDDTTPPADALSFSSEVITGLEIAADGHERSFSVNSMGMKGGGGSILPEDKLRRVEELAATLPEDGAKLPPAGRRVLIEAGALKRVYDRANLPDVVLELMHLINAGIPSYVLEFPPQSQIETPGRYIERCLALSPDGRQLLFTGANGPMQLWEPVVHELLREIPNIGGQGISFSPDGSQAVISGPQETKVLDTRTWRQTEVVAFSQFSCFLPDGRHAVLETRNQPLHVYDAVGWQPVDHFAETPERAVRFRPAPKGARALVETGVRTVSLWDTAAHREIAPLAAEAEVLQAAFSPDGTRVAVCMRSRTRNALTLLEIGIWRASDGLKVSDLRPYEIGASSNDGTGGLLWSPDGKYVLVAATTPEFPGLRGISVFSAATGRHRGEFAGNYRINGLAVFPDGRKLVAGEPDGNIRFWDFAGALEKIAAFEKSLTP
jgi:hypothetical protein